RDYKVTGVQTCALPISHPQIPGGAPGIRDPGRGFLERRQGFEDGNPGLEKRVHLTAEEQHVLERHLLRAQPAQPSLPRKGLRAGGRTDVYGGYATGVELIGDCARI